MPQIDFKRIKSNDVISVVKNYRVIAVNDNNAEVEDLSNGNLLIIDNPNLLSDFSTADHFVETSKVNQRTLADIFSSSYDKCFTVWFQKEDGSERKLRGKLFGPDVHMGRSYVQDLDIDHTSNRMRLVDHRTISRLIVDGVLYEKI